MKNLQLQVCQNVVIIQNFMLIVEVLKFEMTSANGPCTE